MTGNAARKREALILQMPGAVTTNSAEPMETVHTKSNFVDPIPLEYIPKIKKYFLEREGKLLSGANNYRDYAMFVLGCNLGRRIGDMLELKYEDFYNKDRTFKVYLNLLEEKTEKYAKLKINKSVQEAMTLYTEALGEVELSDYIFKSQKLNDDGTQRPITRQQAWRVLKAASEAVGLDVVGVNVGCHSMRKTLGRTALDAQPNNPRQLAMVQKLFNHSSPEITLRYVGLDQRQQDNLLDSIQL